MTENEEETEDEGIAVSGRFLALVILGFTLVLVGVAVLVFVSSVSGGSTSTGVVIFIGPFPIVFGSGPRAGWLIIIGIVLAAASVAVFLVMNKRSRRL
jgi:uncharacterized membrane protein